MINTLYLPELREMLAHNNTDELREFCTALHPGRTAEFMEGLDASETWQVLLNAELPLRAEIFSYFSHERQLEIIETQDRSQIAELISVLAADDRVDLLHDVRPEVVEQLLPLLPKEDRRDILRLQAYPEGTAGAMMTTDVATLDESLTVTEALDQLRQMAEELETIYYFYVVDQDNHLQGVVSARTLVTHLRKPSSRLGELMDTDLVVAYALEDQENVANKVARYDLLAIPVVDEERRLVGIITHDDVIDVVREEATEDAHRIAAVDPLEDSYLRTSLLLLARKRGFWLTILFFAALLTAFALRHYENVLEKDEFKWLVWFIPLVISSGGNTGSQSATLIITALATGDITLKDWVTVVLREIMIGLMLGGFLAVFGFVVAWYLKQELAAATVIPVTLVSVVLCGTLSGSLLPLLFRRLGLDPALMSSPFVAGIIDILGIVIYVNIGLLLLSR